MSFIPYLHLEQQFKKLHIYRGIAALLRWDAAVMMPQGSSYIRGDQLAMLDAECQSILTSKKIAILLDKAEVHVAGLDEWQQANLKEMRRLWSHAKAIPRKLASAFIKATLQAELHWRDARGRKNFQEFAPYLEKVVDLTRQKAEISSRQLRCAPYDALLDEHDPGRTSAEIDRLFMEVRQVLPGLVQKAIEKQSGREPLAFPGYIPLSKQKKLAKIIMRKIGFPFDQGRLDESKHPFTEGPPGDVRITSRYNKKDLLTGLMGVLHETGHALYDFGLPRQWINQPVGRDLGMTVHESQALFLEMMIGRSREFMTFVSPLMTETLGVSGKEWESENLYQQATRVRRSFIRVDADEVTYLEHIAIRYELEKDLFSGVLKVKDLPDAWNAKMREGLGITPSDDSEGCLQDSHWAHGYFGYFSTYALGLLMAAQLRQSMIQHNLEITAGIGKGDFAPALAWLRQNVHNLGGKVSTHDMLKSATGKTLSFEPFKEYIAAKYIQDGA